MNLSDVFDVRFQKSFVAHLARDNEFTLRIGDEFDAELFEDETLQLIARIADDFNKEFGSVPGDLFFSHVESLYKQQAITEPAYHAVAAIWPDLLALDLNNRQYLLNRYDKFLKHLQYQKVVPDALEDVKRGNFENAEKLLHDLITYRAVKKNDMGRLYTDDVSERVYRRMNEDTDRFWTYIPPLDMRVDGLRRGELGVWLSQRSSGGKSAALAFLARSFLLQQKNVLIVTLEMSEEAYEDRLDMAIAAVSRDRLTDAVRISERVGSLLRRGGRLKIKQFPTSRASVQDLERYVKTVESVENFRPDAILLDYADLLRPIGKSGGGSLFEKGQEIYEELRGWIVEEEFACWTASQSNRAAMQASVADQEHVAESLAKIAVADVVLSINRTQEEEQQKVSRLHVVKARNDAARYDITIPTDFETMQFWSQRNFTD